MDTRELERHRVMVTGSAGVIGRELLRRLYDAGSEILSWDQRPLPPDAQLPGVTHIQCDLSTADLTLLKEFRPRVIFHLAAAFERSVETPQFWRSNWNDNVLVSHRLADTLRESDSAEVCVFASSYLIYSSSLYTFQHAQEKPFFVREDSRVSPRNLCGMAKFYGEREFDFLRDQAQVSMRAVHARIYRVYGRGSRDVISRWVRAALQGEELRVYNKENRFDYIFAGDVADGLLRLALAREARGIVNLGSGQGHSISEVLEIVQRYLPNSTERIVDAGSGPPFESSCADITQLEKLLAWRPATTLQQGMKLVLDYERGELAREP